MNATAFNASAPAPAPAPNFTPSPSPHCIDCINNVVSDQAVYLQLVFACIIGVIFLAGFVVLQPYVPIFRTRLKMASVTLKPPTMPRVGAAKFFYWIIPTLFTHEDDVIASAGLDAAITLRCLTVGIKIFFFNCLIACIVIPVNVSQHWLDNNPLANGSRVKSQFQNWTMSNIPQRSALFWLHTVLAFAMMGYTCWLVQKEYERYVKDKQKYDVEGDLPHYWDSIRDPTAAVELGEATSMTRAQANGETQQLARRIPFWRDLDCSFAMVWSMGYPRWPPSAQAQLRHHIAEGIISSVARDAARPKRKPGALWSAALDGIGQTKRGNKAGSHASSGASNASSNAASAKVRNRVGGRRSWFNQTALERGASGAMSDMQRMSPAEQHRVLAHAASDVPVPSSSARPIGEGVRRGDDDGDGDSASLHFDGADAVGNDAVEEVVFSASHVVDVHSADSDRHMAALRRNFDSAHRVVATARQHGAGLNSGGASGQWDDDDINAGEGRLDSAHVVHFEDGKRTGADACDKSVAHARWKQLQHAVLQTKTNDPSIDEAEAQTSPTHDDQGVSNIVPWWATVDGQMNINHKLSRSERRAVNYGGGQQRWHAVWHDRRAMLVRGKPSVRFRKTVNTEVDDEQTRERRRTAVSAQNYVVVVTDALTPAFETLGGFRHQAAHTIRHLSKSYTQIMRHVWSADDNTQHEHDTHSTAAPQQLEMQRVEEPDVEKGQIGADQESGGYQGEVALEAAEAATSWSEVKQLLLQQQDLEEKRNPVAAVMKKLFPEDYVMTIPVKPHQLVDAKLDEWDATVTKLDRAKVIQERLHKKGKPGPTHRVPGERCGAFASCCGEVVESVPYYEKRVAALQTEIQMERVKALFGPPAPSTFVVFKTQKAASIASQVVLHSEDKRTFAVHPAPGPEEVEWQTLWKTYRERDVRRWAVLVPLILLMAVPTGIFAGMISTANRLVCGDGSGIQFSWYCTGTGFWPSIMRQAVTQLLPAILLIVWQNCVMPLALYYCSKVESSSLSLSALDMRVLRLFHYWNVFNAFLGGVIGGSILSAIESFISQPGYVFNVLGSKVALSSKFFINYISLRAFGLNFFRMLSPHGGLNRWLFRCGGKCGCVLTDRDAAAAFSPSSIRFGRELGVFLSVFTAAMAYALVDPFISPFALVYFITAWLVWRYQILYVYVRAYEAGGKIYTVFLNRLLVCAYIFTLFTGCVLITKEAFVQAGLLLVFPPIFLVLFKGHLDKRFLSAMEHVPLESAVDQPPATISRFVYTAPALRPGSAGWHPEYGKAWEGWGACRYSV